MSDESDKIKNYLYLNFLHVESPGECISRNELVYAAEKKIV